MLEIIVVLLQKTGDLDPDYHRTYSYGRHVYSLGYFKFYHSRIHCREHNQDVACVCMVNHICPMFYVTVIIAMCRLDCRLFV